MEQRKQKTEAGDGGSERWRWPAALLVSLLGVGLIQCGPTDPPADDDTGPPVVDAGECTDECDSVGRRVCGQEQAVMKCEDHDGCLKLVKAVQCPSYKLCEGGTCVAKEDDCSNRCTPGDEPRCNDREAVVRCDDHDGDGCFEWGDPTSCKQGEVCRDESGSCEAVDCTDECSGGETTCEGELIRSCVTNDFGCEVFSPGEACPAGQTCQNGACAEQMTCSDECTAAVCGSDGGIRRCADADGDGCKELAAVEACGSDKECRDGSCVETSTCRDECPPDEKICVQNKIAECKDHDGDGCVEFDQPAACPGGATCKRENGSAMCGMPQSQGKVVINEFLYDPIGKEMRGSGANASSPTFIELAGPAGFDISGYTVELVNGSNGNAYGNFTLPTGAQLDGGGRAVLCMTKPSDYFTQTAPTFTNVYQILKPYQPGVDALQNGPDNIVLMDKNGAESDAVGYGFFSSGSSNFVGESSEALPATAGRSLGRVAGADTDNNLLDFQTWYPTPGLANSDLLINEVYPNQPGRDDQTETFVEIAAPIPNWEDLNLDGYEIHAINGHDGKDYLTAAGQGVDLFGHRLHEGNTTPGYFVICSDKAKQASGGPPCNLGYNGGDFQNGPDNIVLTRYGQTIDAVGYGTFASSDHFAGEGKAVSYDGTDAGKSLSRWPLPNLFFDFDDNALDFSKTQPTPGTTNKRP